MLCEEIFNLRCVLFEFFIPNWIRFNFVYQRSVKRIMFKPWFWVQNHLVNMYTNVVNSQRFYCSQKVGVVWNVRIIKAFWYTNLFKTIFQSFLSDFLEPSISISLYSIMQISNNKFIYKPSFHTKGPLIRSWRYSDTSLFNILCILVGYC